MVPGINSPSTGIPSEEGDGIQPGQLSRDVCVMAGCEAAQCEGALGSGPSPARRLCYALFQRDSLSVSAPAGKHSL